MASKIEEKFVKFQFSSRMRLSTYRKLMKFLANGVPLAQALDIMYGFASEDGKKPKKTQAVVLDAWRKNVRNGLSFARAIDGWVPDKDRTVIDAGESAGSLDMAIENAIFIHEGGKKIRGAIVAGLAYPFFLVAIAIGFMAMFGIQVVPAFEEVLPRDNWTGTGASMALLSDFVNNYLLLTLAGFAALITIIVLSLPRWTGRTRVFFDSIPPYSIYRLSAGAGFLLSVSSMVKAGIPIPQALRILQNGSKPWFKEKISVTLGYVNNGQNLGEALYKTKFNFPDKETVNDLRAYASLDGFDDTLEKLGVEWMEESVDKIKSQASVLKNMSFILLGGVFMWIASGIFALQQQIADAAS
jgi:type II secretory pathway component PulF